MLVTPDSQLVDIEVAGSSVFGRYPKISVEATYNMFISDDWLVDYPGWRRATGFIVANNNPTQYLTSGEGRGCFKSARGNFSICVINANVYLVQPDLSMQVLGTLKTYQGEVFIDENLNQQICIVDGLDAYIYSYATGQGLNLTAQNLPFAPTYVQYHNIYFLFGAANESTGSNWYIYMYGGTPTSITLVISQQLQTKPDRPVAVKRIPGQGNNVLVLGNVVCEVWTQIEGPQVYRRNSSFNIDYGCLSLETIAANDKFIFWLGVNETNSPVIMAFTGQSYEGISTDGIDYLMESLKFPQDSTAFIQTLYGHVQYVVTFYNPADNLTLMYDATTQKFFNLTDGDSNYFPARQLMYFNLKTYFVSIKNPFLYELNSDFNTYDENIYDNNFPPDTNLIGEIPRIRITKTIRAPNTSRFIANLFRFILEQGVDTTPPVQDCIIWMITEDDIRIFTEDDIQVVPEGAGTEDCFGVPYRQAVDLAISVDGNATWSNYVRRELNPLGYRRNIIQWERLGACNEIALKLKFWGFGRVVASGGTMEIV